MLSAAAVNRRDRSSRLSRKAMNRRLIPARSFTFSAYAKTFNIGNVILLQTLRFGTPAYMEQIMAATVSGQADQFSLAVTAYQMLSGRRPFSAESGPALMHQIVSEDPQPLHAVNPDVPARASEVIGRALADHDHPARQRAIPVSSGVPNALGQDRDAGYGEAVAESASCLRTGPFRARSTARPTSRT